MKAQQKWVRDYGLKETVYRVGDACVFLHAPLSGPFRGQYVGHASGIHDFDPVREGFPRYYMNKRRAEADLIEWLHRRCRVPLVREHAA